MDREIATDWNVQSRKRNKTHDIFYIFTTSKFLFTERNVMSMFCYLQKLV